MPIRADIHWTGPTSVHFRIRLSGEITRPRVTAAPVHILVVDDDPLICSSYEEILRSRGYQVDTAESRAAALDVIDSGKSIDVLVVDITLPDADGSEVVLEITTRIGQRPTLYVSGWTEEFWNLSDAPGRWLVMRKPIPIPRLIAAVDWLAGRHSTRPPTE